ncbi:uncharacterized protein LOC135462619 [Liolophura sinensis]|uniref:uncharacterized protein LOC135462619 n=1 Tax=Liolophura sinensis TaxID=3198878 RepID=UPI003158A742
MGDVQTPQTKADVQTPRTKADMLTSDVVAVYTIESLTVSHTMYRYICTAENSEGSMKKELTLTRPSKDYDPEMYLHPTRHPARPDDQSSTESDEQVDRDSLGYHLPTSLSTLSSSDENFSAVTNARNTLRGIPRIEIEENVYDTQMYLHPTPAPRRVPVIDEEEEDTYSANATPTSTPSFTPIFQVARVPAERNVSLRVPVCDTIILIIGPITSLSTGASL